MSIDRGKVLVACRRKLEAYRDAYGLEYVGGQELSSLLADIDRALAQPAEAVEDQESKSATPDGAAAAERRLTQAEETEHRTPNGTQGTDPAAFTSADAAQGAVAWRFFVGHSNSWLYEGWTGWTTDAAFRELCERQGFRAEFAYPATNPQAAPAQGAVAFVPVHPKHGPLWGDTYPAGDAADGRSPHYERMPLFTHPQAAPAQGDGWRLCYSAVIHALAAIVSVRCQDKLFDLDAIPRGPVMDQVVLIREAMDKFGKALAAAPSQEGE